MKLHHIAFWTKDIDRLINFYQKYFDGQVLFRYQSGDFSSAFIRIYNCLTLELMMRSVLVNNTQIDLVGYSHFSLEVDSKDEVDRMTDTFIQNEVSMEKIKEQYEDGFYESSVIDPDGNVIEIAFVDRTVNNAV
ncbi:MAG: VOC family protein [Anaerolineae bacterium]|nr:VOC family protein [Anaerolineae bacterium]